MRCRNCNKPITSAEAWGRYWFHVATNRTWCFPEDQKHEKRYLRAEPTRGAVA